MIKDDSNTTVGKDIIAFIHTYQANGKFDPYMTSVIQAFANIGLNVHVVRANDLFPYLSDVNVQSSVRIHQLITLINQINPAFIFTTNRGGITQEVMEKTSCPIITRMVDLVPFYHQGGAGLPLFCERDHVFVPTLESVHDFENRFPILKGKVSYLPFATDPEAFHALKGVEQDIDISFVGTYFYCEPITRLLESLKNEPRWRTLFFKLVEEIKEDFHVHFESLEDAAVISEFCQEFDIDAESLRMFVSNVYALNKRVHYLDALSEFNLQLYGTDGWLQVGSFSMRLLQCFQFDTFIDSREKLIHLYQRSKIALNIPHHQAGAGMPYRVYDIMASNALLITEHHEQSELFSLFGKDVPIPMYRNAQELRDLVQYYLGHEDERLTIVRKCQALIRDKQITFDSRAATFCKKVGVEASSMRQTGHVLYVHQGAWGWKLHEGEGIKDKARDKNNRLQTILTWFLPHPLCVRWLPTGAVVGSSHQVSVDRKMIKLARWFFTKIKSAAYWIIPYKVLLLLKSIVRGI